MAKDSYMIRCYFKVSGQTFVRWRIWVNMQHDQTKDGKAIQEIYKHIIVCIFTMRIIY